MARRRNPSGIPQQRIARVLRIGGEIDVDELVAIQRDRVAQVRKTVLGEVLIGLAAIGALVLWGQSNVAQSIVALLLIPLGLLATSQIVYSFLGR